MTPLRRVTRALAVGALLIPALAAAEPGAIRVEPSSVSLVAGQLGQVRVIAGGIDVTDRVRFEGSDPEIATVEYGGHVAALEEGLTTARVLLDGREVYALRVQVVPAAVTAMWLDGVPRTLEVGEAVRIRAVAYRANLALDDVSDEVRWVSSAPEVVQVHDDGQLVALAPGEAVIDAWIDGKVARSGRILVYRSSVEVAARSSSAATGSGA